MSNTNLVTRRMFWRDNFLSTYFKISSDPTRYARWVSSIQWSSGRFIQVIRILTLWTLFFFREPKIYIRSIEFFWKNEQRIPVLVAETVNFIMIGWRMSLLLFVGFNWTGLVLSKSQLCEIQSRLLALLCHNSLWIVYYPVCLQSEATLRMTAWWIIT